MEKTSENVARGVGELGDVDLVPMAFGGHALYCIKCVRGEQASDDFWDRRIGGIALPTDYAETCMTVQVVAKGPKVGKRCSKTHQKLYQRARCMVDEIEIDDFLLCPSGSVIGIKRSPICDYEFFIEESVPYLIYREKQ